MTAGAYRNLTSMLQRDRPTVMFLYVDDLAAERRRLQGQGIVLGDDFEGDYSTLAQVRDPDGNLITLASQSSRSFPPA